MNNYKALRALIAITASLCLAFFAGARWSHNMALSNEAEKILAEQELRTKHMIAQSTQKGGDATYLSGEIVATSNENITIKVPEGENKVIFLSSETTIMRSTKGKQDDIVTGALISLSGTTNPDGSVNAKSIQLRPEASR